MTEKAPSAPMNPMANDNGTPLVAVPMSEKEGGGVSPQSMDRTECPHIPQLVHEADTDKGMLAGMQGT